MAKIGEKAQRRPDAQQAGLRPEVSRQGIPFRAAHRAQQHRIGGKTGIHRFLGQGDAGGVDGAAAHERIRVVQLIAELFPRGVQHPDGLGHDLRADAVAAQQRDVV